MNDIQRRIFAYIQEISGVENPKVSIKDAMALSLTDPQCGNTVHYFCLNREDGVRNSLDHPEEWQRRQRRLSYYNANCNRACPVKLTLGRARKLFHKLTSLPGSLLQPDGNVYPENWMKGYQAEAGRYTYTLTTEEKGWYTAVCINSPIVGTLQDYYFTDDFCEALEKTWLYRDQLAEDPEDSTFSLRIRNAKTQERAELFHHINSYFASTQAPEFVRLTASLEP